MHGGLGARSQDAFALEAQASMTQREKEFVTFKCRSAPPQYTHIEDPETYHEQYEIPVKNETSKLWLFVVWAEGDFPSSLWQDR